MSGDASIFIKAISAIYDDEVTETDYKNAVDVSSGETASVHPDCVIATAKVVAEESHRYESLRFIYKNWERLGGGIFEAWLPMVLIEWHELKLLWQRREVHTCVIRACSFLQSYFSNTLDVSDETDFGPLIDSAASRDAISQDERKLYHFVREVRNECGHNAWLDLDYPQELLNFACMASIFLIQELSERVLADLGGTSSESAADADYFLQKAKRDFQWSCVVEDGAVKWTPPETWTHPGRAYSTYEDIWAELDEEG